jgi:hypothetical protein
MEAASVPAAALLRGTPRLILAVLVAGCGGPPPTSTALVVSVDTVAGVVHARSSGMPPRWQLTPILTVGSVGAPGDPAADEFGHVVSVGLSPAGELHVADQFASEIRVFSMDGAFVRRIGRQGHGPGEFQSLYSVAWVDSTLLVLDLGNGRIAEIAPDGAWMGQRPAPGRISGNPTMLRFYPVGEDEVYAWSLVPTDSGVRQTYVRHGPTGAESEIDQATYPTSMESSIICQRPDRGISYFDIPFAPRFFQHPLPSDQIVVASTARYRLAVLSAGGDTVRIIERAHQPSAVTSEEWDAALESFRAFRERWPSASCEPRAVSPPAEKAAISDLLVDVRGRIWVEVAARGGNRWEILAPDGSPLGQLPAFSRSGRAPPFLGDGRVAYVTEDSLEVQRVVVATVGPVAH